MDVIQRIKDLTNKLNEYRYEYYNKNNSLVSDKEYDLLFDELNTLENKSGFFLSSSPCKTVGYKVESELQKVKHSHPMLSLDKTKSLEELDKFSKISIEPCLLSLKLDGLTVLLTYKNGELVQAETRGNGEEGEIVTHNAEVFDNVPICINYTGYLEVEGEAVITYNDFEKINSLIENKENKYKNPRNLVSGSVRQLDSKITANRHVKFIVWKVPSIIENFEFNNSFCNKLEYIRDLGFDIVPFVIYKNLIYNEEYTKEIIDELRNKADILDYPIDGLVMTYNNITFGESLGYTSHHPKHSIAFKFYDEVVESTFKRIDWSIGRTGILTPVAIFEPVIIDGTIIEKASVHNISILDNLALMKGDIIEIYKSNDVIPQIRRNISAEERDKNGGITVLQYIKNCPVCGHKTKIICNNNTEFLVCPNEDCKGKLLEKLSHFVSKNAMNIKGLSDATLNKFIEHNLVNSFIDIYKLNYHYNDILKIDGFNYKSVNNLMKSIGNSTCVTLDRFIFALGIPMVGKSTSKDIAEHCDYSYNKFLNNINNNYRWSNVDNIGYAVEDSIQHYFKNNLINVKELSTYINFIAPIKSYNKILNNKIFVITGTLNLYKNREELQNDIELHGGKVVNSISKKVSFLINNNINSNSSKNKKAKELNIDIITENDFLEMIK